MDIASKNSRRKVESEGKGEVTGSSRYVTSRIGACDSFQLRSHQPCSDHLFKRSTMALAPDEHNGDYNYPMLATIVYEV